MNVLYVLTIKCVLTSARTPWLSAIILLNWSGLTVIQYWVFNNVTKYGLFTRPTYVVVVPHRTANTVVQRPRAVLLLRQHRQHLPSLVSVAFDILPPYITSITMNTISNPSPKANGFHYWGLHAWWLLMWIKLKTCLQNMQRLPRYACWVQGQFLPIGRSTGADHWTCTS